VAKSKKQQPSEGIPIRGAVRLNIVEDGEVVWDSGVCENQITAQLYSGAAALFLSVANSTSGNVKYVGIGGGSVPAGSTNSLPGEFTHGGNPVRVTIGSSTVNTATGGATAAIYATFPSGSTGQTGNLSNMGLYVASTGSNLLAGASVATAALSSNQAVNASYSVVFGT
jgi:hypothetical protein